MSKRMTLGQFPDCFVYFVPKKILSSLPLAVPLSSFTQIGSESDTSRRRRLMLYTGANYPLLNEMKGSSKEEWGKEEGVKEKAKLGGGGLSLKPVKGK